MAETISSSTRPARSISPAAMSVKTTSPPPIGRVATLAASGDLKIGWRRSPDTQRHRCKNAAQREHLSLVASGCGPTEEEEVEQVDAGRQADIAFEVGVASREAAGSGTSKEEPVEEEEPAEEVVVEEESEDLIISVTSPGSGASDSDGAIAIEGAIVSGSASTVYVTWSGNGESYPFSRIHLWLPCISPSRSWSA